MSTERKDIHNSEVPLVCRSCEARHRGVCGALDENQLVQLAKHTHRTTHNPEEELFAAESSSTHYSNVLRGVVKLTKLMPDGRQQIVGLQFSPDFLGRPFEKTNRLDAQAADEVELCSFPKSVLNNMIKNSPDLEHKLFEQTLRELDESREMMLTLGRKTASEKVATFLQLLATHIDPELEDHEGPVEFELALKRSDIADYLGLTIETVSRQMTKLRKAGIIDIQNNRHIRIPDLGRLIDMTES